MISEFWLKRIIVILGVTSFIISLHYFGFLGNHHVLPTPWELRSMLITGVTAIIGFLAYIFRFGQFKKRQTI